MINAAWYAGEAIYYGLTGNHEMMMQSLKGMGCSLLSALPGIGSFIGQGMKMTIKGVDVGCTIIKGSKMIGYGASAVMSGYGSINGGLEMYRKYAVNGEQMGWHTFGEAGSVALMGVAAVGSGKMAAISANGTWCFTGDTLVATDEGAKPIERIKEGDVVLSEDTETGEQSYQSVVQIFISKSDTLIHVVTGEDEIEATAMHPFYVIGRGFVPAGELEAGDWLKDSQGRVVEVVEVWMEVLDEPVLVYNLEVEETHTYYVGTGMVLVHNNCYGLGGTTPKPGDSDFVGPLPDKGGTKDIYRAVSPEELGDISTHGFRPRADGRSFQAKEFGNNFEETLNFANHPINSDKAAIVKVTIPENIYNQLNHMNLDRNIFKSGTPVVEPEMLGLFNESIINIEHVY